MPICTFKCVREVSSEDSVHTAENLLKQLPGKKWKTQKSGEKLAYVILEFEESEQITGIDIGNEHSAFVEVLVSKTGCKPEDFTEILITCSLMTPPESKSSNNTNRVRCFNEDALVPTVRDKKWKMVKVICTQPFNKHVQYGLSFIKVHVAQSNKKVLVPQKYLLKEPMATDKNIKALSTLQLREGSPDSESECTAALFNRWKTEKQRNLHNNVSNTTVKTVETHSDKLKSPNNLRPSKNIEQEKRLSQHKQENSKLSKDEEKPSKLSQKQNENKKHANLDTARALKRSSSPNTKNDASNNSPAKKIKTGSQLEAVKKYCPFNKLLKGVVFVVSGIQNPHRADLRDKAMAMGAKYKTNWGTDCTHLICAFKNTPKYNEVKGKGKIVNRHWIEKCYAAKKYLPWRRFALESTEAKAPESDEEVWDVALRPQQQHDKDANVTCLKDKKNSSHLISDPEYDSYFEKDTDLDLETSGSDSETELQRIIEKNKLAKLNGSQNADTNTKNMSQNSDNDYDVSTEEEDYLSERKKSIQISKKC